MASFDDILGPEPQAGPAKSFDEMLGSAPSIDPPSPIHDLIFGDPKVSPQARILDAFGHGLKDGWGTEPLGLSEESEAFLKKAGVFPDYEKGRTGIIRAFNEALIRPAASALDAASRVPTALFRGAQAGTEQQALELGASPTLARDIAALPEAFMAGGPGGMPPHPAAYTSAEIAKARSLGVIGAGEAGWKGTRERAEPHFGSDEAHAEALKEQHEEQAAATQAEGGAEIPPGQVEPSAPQAAPPPDIHQMARQIAPDTFTEYDALTQRRDTFRRWIDELKATQREQAEANAPHAAEIAELQSKMEDASPRMAKKYQARLDEMVTERDDFVSRETTGDSPDMTRVRKDLMAADYRMRDLAPEVSAAYREAQSRMPAPEQAAQAPAEGAGAPEAIAAPDTAAAAEPAPVAPGEAAAVSGEAKKAEPIDIAQDITKNLVAAGRPVEESEASAAVVQSMYEAYAARFNGAKGTAAEIYAREAPEIRAAKGAAIQLEMAQQKRGAIALKDGRNVIRLMKDADASTFMHETGHDWLERLMRDARDDQAPADLTKDASTVRQWLGASEDAAITRAQHEKFARGFERYLMEGVAPNQRLAGVFAKFKAWLTQIYQTVAKLRAPITDDIRRVFDRLVATPEHGAVIAGEREPTLSFADAHERLAETTAPEQAVPVADTIRSERDATAPRIAPEIEDERLGGRGSEAGGGPPGGPLPDGGGNAGQPDGGAARPLPEPGTLGAGGGAAAAEGPRPRAETLAPPVYRRVPREPLRLLDFLRLEGGLRDEGGDVAAIMGGAGGKKGLRNLINKKTGLPIDEAIERAWEAGYFPGVEDPKSLSPRDLHDAIERDSKQAPIYSDKDIQKVQEYQEALAHNAEVDRLSHTLGIDPTGKTGQEFWDAVAEKMSAEKAASEAETLAAAHEAALAEAEGHTKEWLASRGEAWEPDQFYGSEPRTLEDLEREHQSEELARREGQSPGGAGESGPAAADTGDVQAGGGQGGRGAGAGRSAAKTEEPTDPNARFADSGETRLLDKAGNIRLDNLGTPEDVNQVLRETAEKNGDFLNARRGVISDAQVLDLADALGMDAAQINRRKLGQAFNAEEVVAARKLLIQSATHVRDLAASAAEGSEAEIAAFAEALTRHRMIQEQVSGITAEAGRALRAFRAMEGEQGLEAAALLKQTLNEATGRTLNQLQSMARMLNQIGTPSGVSRFVQQSARTGVFDWLQSLFINNLISGPFTHAGYTVAGELLALFRAVGETGAAGLVGKFRDVAGLGPAERASLAEVPYQLYGMGAGAWRGIQASWPAFKSNAVMLPGEVQAYLGRQTGSKAQPAGQPIGRTQTIPDIGRIPVGTVIESPGRLVAALHTFNWTTFYTQSMAGQAFQTAFGEGKVGEALAARVADLLASPTDAMIEQGITDANGGALMNRPKYDSLMGNVSRLTNWGVQLPDIPLPGDRSLPLGTLRPLKYIDPFVQIQANVQKVAFGRGTPLALFSKEVRADLMMKNGGAAFDKTAGKIIAGTSFMVGAGWLASQGLMNPSGPTEPAKAREWQRINGLPHGLRVGNLSFDMLRLGPLGMQMSVAADLYHAASQITHEDASKASSELVHAFTQNVLDESFMRGPAEIMRAVEDSDRYGDAWIRNFAKSFVPLSVGFGQVTRQIDPWSRQARTTVDAIKSIIPGESETLFPRHDVWGQPVPNRGWAGTYYQHIGNDPVDRALYPLGIYPALPQRRIRGVPLTDQQYDDYSAKAGQMAYQRLRNTVALPGFSQFPVEQQIRMIKSDIDGAHEMAADLMLLKSWGTKDDIAKAAMTAKTEPLRRK